MLVAEALELHEGAAGVLEKFGLPCYRCAVADVETVAEGAAARGLDVERILAALNALFRKETPRENSHLDKEEGPNRSSQDEG